MTVTEGIKEAQSHKEDRVLLEKRKEIPPSYELSSRAEPAKKKRRKAKSKAKTQTTAPTPDNPVIVEDEIEDYTSSKSIEHVFEAVLIQTKFPGFKIREPEVVVLGPSTNKPSSSDRKGKRVLEFI